MSFLLSSVSKGRRLSGNRKHHYGKDDLVCQSRQYLRLYWRLSVSVRSFYKTTQRTVQIYISSVLPTADHYCYQVDVTFLHQTVTHSNDNSPVFVFSQHWTYLTSPAKWTKSSWEKILFCFKMIIQWIVNAVCLLCGWHRRVRSASSSRTRDGRRTTSLWPALLKSSLLPKASRWPPGPHVCQVTCFSYVIGQ